VMHRPSKDGLGRAYLAGFQAALDGGADLILQMDCDFSHDPEDVPRLLEAAATADVALGSRYVPGGGVENWALRRRLQSRGGCAYARLILRVPVRDLTGGFKCWNRRALEALDFDGVDAHGYGFQIEMTYRALRAGLSVTEVPIVFRERREGQSKMTLWITLEAVWKVPALRLRG
jgi:dolichol-phosphate mannosyltransferase